MNISMGHPKEATLLGMEINLTLSVPSQPTLLVERKLIDALVSPESLPHFSYTICESWAFL